MKRGMVILLVASFVIIVAALGRSTAPPASAQEAPDAGPAVERPTVAVARNSCVTADCHTGVKDHRVLHGPVNVNACDACHQSVDVTKHTFQLKRKQNELCAFCHQLDMQDAKFVHEPLKTGDCIGCHNPHGGHDTRMLQGLTLGPMCISCHEEHDFAEHASIHGPVASGDCGGCHTSHTADHEKLLHTTGRDLCMSCHREMDQHLHTYPVVHEPVMKQCTQCHDPHASAHRMMTRAPSMQLCTNNCHEDVRKAVTDAKFKHSAVSQDEGCANCHNPHGGTLAALMKAEPVSVCLKCHDKPIERDGQVLVAAVAQIAEHNLHKHGPVREGSCAGCHDVHGSDHSRLLAANYTDDFYEPFAVEHYDLCFNCHAKDLATLPTTKGATAFRDGEKNLHYVHVNKAKRGRTCSACHDTHASDNAHIVREKVAFGKWEMPINFQPTRTGGSCTTGCHQTLRYDREQPANDVLLPAEETASSRVPRASGTLFPLTHAAGDVPSEAQPSSVNALPAKEESFP